MTRSDRTQRDPAQVPSEGHAGEASRPPDGGQKWWALVASCLGTFMLLLDVTKVITALPQIELRMGTTPAQAEWVVNAYLLVMSATLLVFGTLADRFGHRRIFLIGLAAFTAASLGGGLAGDVGLLIASRAVQGAGGAMMYATSLSLLAQNFHGRERGTAFGVWGAVTGLATGLGPIVGGALTSGMSWRAVLLINVPLGAVVILVTVLGVHADRPTSAPKRVDAPGFVTFTVALLGLVFGIVRAGDASWSDGLALGSIAVGIAMIAAFILIESRVAEPMFDLSLLRVPTFSGGLVAAFAMNGSLFAMFVTYAIYLQHGLGYGAFDAGLRLLVITGGTTVVSVIAGKLSGRVPVRWLIAPGLLVVGIGILLTATVTADSGWIALVPGFLIAGIGAGLVNPPLASTAVGVVPPSAAGMASGINSTFRMFGQSLAIAVYGSILAAQLRSAGAGEPGEAAANTANAAASTAANYSGALESVALIAGIVAIVGAVLSFVLIRTRDFVTVSLPAPREQPAPRERS